MLKQERKNKIYRPIKVVDIERTPIKVISIYDSEQIFKNEKRRKTY